MRRTGHADLIPIMGGHTSAVGVDHYADSEAIVKRVKAKEL